VDDAIDDLIASLDRTFGNGDAAAGGHGPQLKQMETHVRILPPVSMGKGFFPAIITARSDFLLSFTRPLCYDSRF